MFLLLTSRSPGWAGADIDAPEHLAIGPVRVTQIMDTALLATTQGEAELRAVAYNHDGGWQVDKTFFKALAPYHGHRYHDVFIYETDRAVPENAVRVRL